jgi:hypothetical protein
MMSAEAIPPSALSQDLGKMLARGEGQRQRNKALTNVAFISRCAARRDFA